MPTLCLRKEWLRVLRNTFSKDLLEKAKPAALKEFADLTAFAKKLDGLEQLEKWDGAYYSEKLKQELSLDEKLKPYFQLEKSARWCFTIASKLYETFTEFLILISTTK
jgi:peptidyl-dipeptidase Dcp